MVTFCLLVAPLPFAIKKRVFTFLSESFVVAKIAYGLKISFMWVTYPSLDFTALTNFPSFVAILFADAVQRMFRVSAEVDIMKSGRQGVIQDYKSDTSMAARKF